MNSTAVNLVSSICISNGRFYYKSWGKCKSDCCHILAPFRRPSLEFSKTAFVKNLNAAVIAPDATTPAKKDWKSIHTEQCSSKFILNKFWTNVSWKLLLQRWLYKTAPGRILGTSGTDHQSFCLEHDRLLCQKQQQWYRNQWMGQFHHFLKTKHPATRARTNKWRSFMCL